METPFKHNIFQIGCNALSLLYMLTNIKRGSRKLQIENRSVCHIFGADYRFLKIVTELHVALSVTFN
jgi:hypothetical protein